MRIVIVGGSMAGLFAASLLQEAGQDVVVVERSKAGLGGRGPVSSPKGKSTLC